ncbi:hypothetical protein [Methylorubrum aminovorans]
MRSASTTGAQGRAGGSTRLPANIAPRCLTRAQAAEYCGCETVEAFDGWVRKGIVPGPITGTHRWDRRAIDRALDRRSGLISGATTSIDEWLAENAS